MLKRGVFLAFAASLLLIACGGKPTSTPPRDGLLPFGTTAPAATATPAPRFPLLAPAGPAGPAGAPAPAPIPTTSPEFSAASKEGGSGATSALALDVAQRQVISSGSVSLEVTAVQPAVAQVRAIAESLGGFMEQLASSGSPDRQQATLTIRVPQAQFFVAVERVSALGELLGQNLGSQDVTEQFIDLNARLQSAQREEKSLLDLLGRVTALGDVLSLERELSRVRSDIERLQGQLDFIKRRVDLATLAISLTTKAPDLGKPPSVSLGLQVRDVTRSVEAVKATVANLGGTVDLASISLQDGKRTARVSLRVFAAQFDQALGSFEGLGKVTSKELQEGRPPKGEATPPKEPNARIELVFEGKTPWWPLAVGAVAAAAAGGAILYLGYRVGRLAARRTGP